MTICKGCRFYEPDYGIFTATGWTRNGSEGLCHIEPRAIRVYGERIACRYFEGK